MPKGRKEKSELSKKQYDKKRAGQRTRNWTFIVYPESAAENWRELLDDEHLEWIESPLHDRDINATGESKKPHIHVLVLYGGVKAYEQVEPLTKLLGVTIPQRCANAKALVRYMAHMDNPEKAQYDVGGIVGHGGVDVAELLRPSSSERYQLIAEMMDYVQDSDIMEMEDLLMYARQKRFDDWFPLLCDNSAYIMGALLKSRRHRGPPLPLRTVKVDHETGEIVE